MMEFPMGPGQCLRWGVEQNEVSIHTAGRVYSDRWYMHTANKLRLRLSKLG